MELTLEHVRSIIFYNYRRGLSRQECIGELKPLFDAVRKLIMQDRHVKYREIEAYFPPPAYIQYCRNIWP